MGTPKRESISSPQLPSATGPGKGRPSQEARIYSGRRTRKRRRTTQTVATWTEVTRASINLWGRVAQELPRKSASARLLLGKVDCCISAAVIKNDDYDYHSAKKARTRSARRWRGTAGAQLMSMMSI
jgi:hypothetical protein